MITADDARKIVEDFNIKADKKRQKYCQRKLKRILSKIKKSAKKGLNFHHFKKLPYDIETELVKLKYKVKYLENDKIWVVTWEKQKEL